LLYIFDKDGTLIGQPDQSDNRPANSPSEQTVLPRVIEKINSLRQSGHDIAIASNQGGVAWEYISFTQAHELLQDCAEKIGGATYEFCPHDLRAKTAGKVNSFAVECDCRKPKPGMIISLMNRLHYNANHVVFVGDMDTDRLAAENAGVTFVWAKNFFITAGD